jgi:hypothetical protein
VKHSSRLSVIVVGLTAFAGLVSPAWAQSLRGSNASVRLMHRSALRGGLNFYETSAQVRRAVARKELVSLKGNANYTISNVRTPYVRRETRSFVTSLAAGYRRACGARMVVTSATRPMSRKLANGSALSVHPTGMAIDLRRPKGRCLTWLRRTLMAAERRGAIEATEERRPPHFHVAVLPARYQKASASSSGRPTAKRQARAKR